MAKVQVKYLMERIGFQGGPKTDSMEKQLNEELGKIKGRVIDIKFEVEKCEQGRLHHAFIVYEEE